MTDGILDSAIRAAIGGDASAISWILAQAATTDEAVVISMAALLERQSNRLHRAEVFASTTRDRQLVAIARAHLEGHAELVDALARDHLVDFPDSLVVAWIAANAMGQTRRSGLI